MAASGERIEHIAQPARPLEAAACVQLAQLRLLWAWRCWKHAAWVAVATRSRVQF